MSGEIRIGRRAPAPPDRATLCVVTSSPPPSIFHNALVAALDTARLPGDDDTQSLTTRLRGIAAAGPGVMPAWQMALEEAVCTCALADTREVYDGLDWLQRIDAPATAEQAPVNVLIPWTHVCTPLRMREGEQESLLALADAQIALRGTGARVCSTTLASIVAAGAVGAEYLRARMDAVAGALADYTAIDARRGWDDEAAVERFPTPAHEVEALRRALGYWRRHASDGGGAPQRCVTRVWSADALTWVARIGRGSVTLSLVARTRDGVDTFGLRADVTLEVDGHPLECTAVFLPTGDSAMETMGAAHQQARILLPDVACEWRLRPVPQPGWRAIERLRANVTPARVSARLLAACEVACAHSAADWLPNATGTARVLSCPHCGRRRIALCWIDRIAPDSPARPPEVRIAHAAAVRDAQRRLGRISEPPEGVWPDVWFAPERWATEAVRPRRAPRRGGDAERTLAGRRHTPARGTPG